MSDTPDPIEVDFLGDIETPGMSNGHAGGDFTPFDSVEYSTSPSVSNVDIDDELKDEVTDSQFGDITQPLGDGACVVCGEATFRPPGLTKAGYKKRVPRHCNLHAPNAKVPPTGPNLKGVESQLQRVQAELADDLRLLATLAGPLLPVTGMYLFEQADPFTIAIIKLAKNNQRIIRVLHRAASIAPVYTVAETVAGTAYAIQVDTKGADPHNKIAKRLRVEGAYNLLYESDDVAPQAPTFNGPPIYQTVQ